MHLWHAVEVLAADHHAQVPQLGALVLAVGYAVPSIALWRDKRDALGVAGQNSCWFSSRERPSVPVSSVRARTHRYRMRDSPDLDEGIIAATDQDIAAR